MVNVTKDTFGYLGNEYQFRLIAQILNDKKFANLILDIISPNYFDDQYLKLVVSVIKEAKDENDIILDIDSLQIRLFSKYNDEVYRKYFLSTIKKITEVNLNDSLFIQDSAIRFCKQQEIKRSVREISKLLDKGQDDFETCEPIFRRPFEIGLLEDDGLDVLDKIESALADDFRDPIPTGINGLDEIMNGGLSRGEIALVIAAMGTGKTTLAVKLANNAFNEGKNVLQIFFEDTPKQIQRKHLACWTETEINDLSDNKEYVLNIVNEKVSNGGKLKLKKFPSVGTTMSTIRKYIRKKIAEGFIPDLVTLDYIDCVEPSRRYDDANIGEGAVMREFETMAYELNFAGWCFTQGNRSSISSEVVDTNQIGGSIKKAQIAHFNMSIGKTMDQKENRTATIAILKSRIGDDGMILQDILFDNKTIKIDMSENQQFKSRSEYKIDKEKSEQERVKEILERKKSVDNIF